MEPFDSPWRINRLEGDCHVDQHDAKSSTLAVSLALAAGLAGCRIHTEKGANGEDKNVQVDTPFGGIHVNTDQTTASDLGLPVYPGARR